MCKLFQSVIQYQSVSYQVIFTTSMLPPSSTQRVEEEKNDNTKESFGVFKLLDLDHTHCFLFELVRVEHIAAIVTKELLTKQVPRDHSTVNLPCVGGEFHSPARLQSIGKYKRRLASLIRSHPDLSYSNIPTTTE